jgi:hypothetical protein
MVSTSRSACRQRIEDAVRHPRPNREHRWLVPARRWPFISRPDLDPTCQKSRLLAENGSNRGQWPKSHVVLRCSRSYAAEACQSALRSEANEARHCRRRPREPLGRSNTHGSEPMGRFFHDGASPPTAGLRPCAREHRTVSTSRYPIAFNLFGAPGGRPMRRQLMMMGQ